MVAHAPTANLLPKPAPPNPQAANAPAKPTPPTPSSSSTITTSSTTTTTTATATAAAKATTTATATAINSQTSDAHRCPYHKCGKSFSKKYNLKAHLRLHTGELPFQCPRPNCLKKFKWRSSLSSHAVWHNRKELATLRQCAATVGGVPASASASTPTTATAATTAAPTAKPPQQNAAASAKAVRPPATPLRPAAAKTASKRRAERAGAGSRKRRRTCSRAAGERATPIVPSAGVSASTPAERTERKEVLPLSPVTSSDSACELLDADLFDLPGLPCLFGRTAFEFPAGVSVADLVAGEPAALPPPPVDDEFFGPLPHLDCRLDFEIDSLSPCQHV